MLVPLTSAAVHTIVSIKSCTARPYILVSSMSLRLAIVSASRIARRLWDHTKGSAPSQ